MLRFVLLGNELLHFRKSTWKKRTDFKKRKIVRTIDTVVIGLENPKVSNYDIKLLTDLLSRTWTSQFTY